VHQNKRDCDEIENTAENLEAEICVSQRWLTLLGHDKDSAPAVETDDQNDQDE
jgi:hypothetical protein